MRLNSICGLSKVVIALVFLSINYSVYAGTTGKISGIIKDAETLEPLPGVNIIIDGTNMGGATNVEGIYTILNIPPGTFTLKISMIGYKVQIIENVRVLVDLTTTINASLTQTVLEAGEEVTIVAEKPLVQRDMTSSLATVSSSEIRALPVQEISDVLELQAGIVNSGGIHIRGGRSGEVAFWIDGVATTDVFSGGPGITVENASVEELQVVSGTFNAEYGQAMSGIVNIVTKEGGLKYTGQIKAWVGDYISNNSDFQVLERVDELIDPVTGAKEPIGKSENPLKKFNPGYNAEFSLEGPLPLTKDKITFFTNIRYVADEGYLYGREWFLPYGLPGDSSLVPLNPYKRASAQFKLTYKLSPNIKLSYNAFLNQSEQERTYVHEYKYNPGGIPQQHDYSTSQIFTLNHVLSPTTFYDVRVNRFYREYEQYVYKDPSVRPSFLIKVFADTTAGLPEEIFDPETDAGKARLEAIKAAERLYTYITDPATQPGYVHPDSSQQPVGYSFLRAGQNLNHYKRSTAYWIGKFDFTSQFSSSNQFKAGFEYRLHELYLDSYTIQKRMQEGKTEEIVPFSPFVPPVSTINHDNYTRNPREFSSYIQDKMELKDIIINLGLRYDYFDANSVVLADPMDPNIYDPMLDSHRYKNPDAPVDERIEYTPDERRAFMHKNVDAKMKLSPRLGIAYPITDKGVIHFSYGHFFQIPEFQYLYDSPDFKFSKGGLPEIVGNADLEPQKTVMYEIGLQQQITDDIGIDVTLFYRDVRDWVGTSARKLTYLPAVAYVVYENKDYSNVRGITLKIEKRYSHNFFANLDYSYQVAEGTYSNPEDAFNASQSQEEPRLAILPLNWDQNHTFNASLSYSLNDWLFSIIGRYWTGRPYTPSFARGSQVGTSTYSGLRENSARLPNVKGVDLNINRRIQFSNNMAINVFMIVYNVFDIHDETAVYGDTGSAAYTTTIDPDIIDYDTRRIGTVEHFVNRANWYTAPRQIQFGASIEF
ncbi:MAG TPA: TonB-dependent receptor [bacterium]|nr:TonB-dependent receptor [bacterium]HPN46291.1 TonB-dependent receptor [bacterium]